MAGLDPAIHAVPTRRTQKVMAWITRSSRVMTKAGVAGAD
jgi:hypothetical protein